MVFVPLLWLAMTQNLFCDDLCDPDLSNVDSFQYSLETFVSKQYSMQSVH